MNILYFVNFVNFKRGNENLCAHQLARKNEKKAQLAFWFEHRNVQLEPRNKTYMRNQSKLQTEYGNMGYFDIEVRTLINTKTPFHWRDCIFVAYFYARQQKNVHQEFYLEWQ